MNNKLSSKRLSICYYLQYLLLYLSLYLFSSKITFLPWYIPLTTYVLLYILILMLLQIGLFLYTWYIYEKHISFKNLRKICFLHVLLLLIMSILCIFSVYWFYLCSILSTCFIVLLIFYQKILY